MGHVKRRLSPGSSALNSRRQTAFKNIEKHLKKHEATNVSGIEKHKKEMDILKQRLV